MSLRVVSLNTWGGRVFAPLIAFVESIHGDVLCLQEVFSAPATDIESVQDSDGHHVRVNLFQDLQQRLPEHAGFFYPFAKGYLNDTNTTELPVFYGIATFVRKTISIVTSLAGFVFGEFRDGQSHESQMPRNAHGVRLVDGEHNATFAVAHTHGLWDRRGKFDTDERIVQTANLVALLDHLCQPKDKIVVCGDFNVLPSSSLFHALRSKRLEDLVVRTGITDTRTSYYSKSLRYADYMLVSPEVGVTRFAVRQSPEVSDHRPLILDCE
jgi:endonuclease/exonuclease/phosphatase family metal-dependent hydrolase